MAIRGRRWSRRRLQPPPLPPRPCTPSLGVDSARRHSAPELLSELGGSRHPNLHHESN